jgi:hypothetical protein
MMSNYLKICAVNLLIHCLGFATLVALNEFILRMYLAWGWEFGSRGIAPGAAIRLVLLTFFITNLAIVLIPARNIKFLTSIFFVLVTAWFLLPSHPLRAIFYCSSGLAITMSCIYGSSWSSKKLLKTTNAHLT